VGQSVTFTAVLTGSYVTPTGSVTFEKGKTSLGTVGLADGQAQLTATFAKSGNFTIKASYSGDQIYQEANSKRFKQVVGQ
jgi:Bacterial Ig-like domain (group 3)